MFDPRINQRLYLRIHKRTEKSINPPVKSSIITSQRNWPRWRRTRTKYWSKSVSQRS